MNFCLQNYIIHQFTYILYIIHIKASSNIQELQESNKYIKFSNNKFIFFENYYSNLCLI